MRKALFCTLITAALSCALPLRAQEEMPSSVDNSLLKYFPTVIDQVGGSCAQASYIGYMFTYEMNRLLDRDGSTADNQFSYLYAWNFINGGQDEGSIGEDGLKLGFEGGIVVEEDFPSQYTSSSFNWASGYDTYFRALHYRVKKIKHFEVTSKEGVDEVRQYLWNRGEPGKPGGVVTFSSRAGAWTIDTGYSGPSQTGYKALLTKLSPTGAHAMTIVGYDDTVEFDAPDGSVSKGAFIVCNTYGTWYPMHDRGRFYLPYWFWEQADRDFGTLGREMSAVDVEYREPSVVFKVGVDYTSRDDLSFRIGISGKASDTTPQHDFAVPVARNQGGDYPMCGNWASSEIEFAFDFSSYAGRIDECEEPNFFLTVSRAARGKVYGEGKMTSFAVYDYRADKDNPTVYVCPDIRGKVLENGDNIFNIRTVEAKTTSYSPVEWLSATSRQPVAAPLVLRTAKGNYAKLRFSSYDREKGTIKLKYTYAPDGSRRLE